jgi:hypothetical protein
MRAHPFIFGGLLALAACEARHQASVPVTASPSVTPSPTAATQQPAPLPVATAAARTDTTLLLSQALGAKLQGYRLESFTEGDINQDQRPDFIAIFQTSKAEDSTASEPRGVHFRRVALILNQGWPRLKLAATNDNVIDCSGCAHMAMYDAYQGTTITGPYFSFESTDGGCTRTMEVRTFRYSKAQKNWFLHKMGRDTMVCSDSTQQGADHEERTTRDFGKIAFDKFESVDFN